MCTNNEAYTESLQNGPMNNDLERFDCTATVVAVQKPIYHLWNQDIGFLQITDTNEMGGCLMQQLQQVSVIVERDWKCSYFRKCITIGRSAGWKVRDFQLLRDQFESFGDQVGLHIEQAKVVRVAKFYLHFKLVNGSDKTEYIASLEHLFSPLKNFHDAYKVNDICAVIMHRGSNHYLVMGILDPEIAKSHHNLQIRSGATALIQPKPNGRSVMLADTIELETVGSTGIIGKAFDCGYGYIWSFGAPNAFIYFDNSSLPPGFQWSHHVKSLRLVYVLARRNVQNLYHGAKYKAVKIGFIKDSRSAGEFTPEQRQVQECRAPVSSVGDKFGMLNSRQFGHVFFGINLFNSSVVKDLRYKFRVGEMVDAYVVPKSDRKNKWSVLCFRDDA